MYQEQDIRIHNKPPHRFEHANIGKFLPISHQLLSLDICPVTIVFDHTQVTWCSKPSINVIFRYLKPAVLWKPKTYVLLYLFHNNSHFRAFELRKLFNIIKFCEKIYKKKWNTLSTNYHSLNKLLPLFQIFSCLEVFRQIKKNIKLAEF